MLADLLLLQLNMVLHIGLLLSNLLLVLDQVLRDLTKLRLQCPPEDNATTAAALQFLCANCEVVHSCKFLDVGLWAFSMQQTDAVRVCTRKGNTPC